MAAFVRLRGAAGCRPLALVRVNEERECALPSQASRRLLLTRRTPNWQPPPQRPTHFGFTTVTDPHSTTTTTTYNDINVSGTVTGVLGGSFTGTFSGSFSDPVLTSTGQVIGDFTVVLGGIISGTLSNFGVISGTDTVTVTVTFSDGLSGSEQFTVTSNNFSGQNNGGSGTVYGSIPFSMGGSVNSLGGASGPLNGSFGLDFSTAGETSGSYSTPYSGLLVQGTSYSYNALGEQTSVTDALGDVTTYGYDADGNVTTVTDPDGNTTTTTYNGLNEPVNVTNETCGCAGKSGTTTYQYNDAGQQTSMTDPSGNATSYSYDGQGRMLAETGPDLTTTSYAYDLAGNQTSETDPAFNTTTYAYNAANERTSTTQPQAPNNPETYAYNSAGELTSATDPDGRNITYAYNKAGQETAMTWVGGNYTATYNYNNDGELTSVSDPNSAYSYTYDALGQQTSVSNAGTPGVPAVTLDYGYDSFGNRTSLTDSLGGSISYAYNAGNEMMSLGLSLSTTLDAQVTLAYDGAGNVTGMTQTAPSASNPHTIATSYSYNHSNELTNITYMDTTANVTLANYTYGYNTAGVLTSSQDNSGNSLSYGYDSNNELTSATGTLAGSSYTFTYDYGRNGNRTSTSTDVNGTLTSASYTTGTGNELQSDGTYSYTYDNNGNMLTQTNIATGSVTYYTWDYENRLTEVRTGTSDEKCTYDVFGDRIGVSLNGTQQLFTVYDGSNPYMDFSGSGTLTERYLTNPNGLNQFFGQVNASGTTQWFVTDNLGSIRQVVDSSGNVLDAIVYDPYGNIVNQTNSANAPRFLYTGAAYDAITGTYLDGAREDNPADGRWVSQDPSGLGPDTNSYRYVANDPASLSDPTGLIVPLVRETAHPHPDISASIVSWKIIYLEGKKGEANLNALGPKVKPLKSGPVIVSAKVAVHNYMCKPIEAQLYISEERWADSTREWLAGEVPTFGSGSVPSTIPPNGGFEEISTSFFFPIQSDYNGRYKDRFYLNIVVAPEGTILERGWIQYEQAQPYRVVRDSP